MSSAYTRLQAEIADGRWTPHQLDQFVPDLRLLLAVVEAGEYWRHGELPEWEITKAEDQLEAALRAVCEEGK